MNTALIYSNINENQLSLLKTKVPNLSLIKIEPGKVDITENLNNFEKIYLKSDCVKLLKPLVLKLKLHSQIKTLKGKNSTLLLVTQSIYNHNVTESTNTSGHNIIDTITHSNLEVEKTARIAYEKAENLSNELLNIYETKLASNFEWSKVVIDINEDYPTVSLNEETLIDFILKYESFDLNNKSIVILSEPLQEDSIYRFLEDKGFNFISQIYVGDTNQTIELI